MSTLTFAEIQAGTRQTFSKFITDAEGALYAGLVGDASFVGLSAPGSVNRSFQKPVHHLFMAGIVGSLLSAQLPGNGARCLNLQFEFLAPIYTGDCIDTSIDIALVDVEKKLATCQISCCNQNKDQVMTGQAVMLLAF